jgi:hypothetical protein
MRIVGAEVDVDDERHFTITYEMNGQRGTIDGWLLSGRAVTLEVRDGPLETPGLPPPANSSETSDARSPASRAS